MDRSVCVIGREKGTSFWRITAFFFYSLRLEIWEAIGLTSDIKWEEEGEREMARWSWQHWLPCLPCPPVGQGTEPDPDALTLLAMSDAAAIMVEYARVRETRRTMSPTSTRRLGSVRSNINVLTSIASLLYPAAAGPSSHPDNDTHNNIAERRTDISTGIWLRSWDYVRRYNVLADNYFRFNFTAFIFLHLEWQGNT